MTPYLLRTTVFLSAIFTIAFTHAQTETLSDSQHLGKNYRRHFEKSTSCVDFENFMFRNQLLERAGKKKFKKEEAMRTDQLIVYRKGKIYYEAFDGYFKKNTPHCLWSASKSITATLAAAAAQQGDLNLESRLNDFFPASRFRTSLANQQNEKRYRQIKLMDLVSMSSGMEWHESYDDDPIRSTFMPMLYGKGRSNMLSYAISQPMGMHAPATRWTYSGGNSLILMGVLKKIAAKKEISLNQYLSSLIFDRLQMKSAFFETDVTGTAVGNSYAFLTPEEMLKIGILYLQNGIYNGIQILDPNFVKMSLQQSDGILNTAQVATLGPDEFEKLKKVVIREGAYSQTGFWLNQDVKNIMKNEFKNSPKDMYFAAGHYGQLIMIIPSEETVIIRTGHDSDYWSRIDSMVSKTLACTRDLEKFLPSNGDSNERF